MNYDLSHLTQPDDQKVIGPIQDDEALLLFALCRSICARHVVEFGGLEGYSARNFLAAVGPEGFVITVDCRPVDKLAPNHFVVQCEAKDIAGKVFFPNGKAATADLVLFDCHSWTQEMSSFKILGNEGVITKKTVLAIHDTGTHPSKMAEATYLSKDGWIHCEDERRLVNLFQDIGYDCVSFHAPNPRPPLEYRHGLTICQHRQRFQNDPV